MSAARLAWATDAALILAWGLLVLVFAWMAAYGWKFARAWRAAALTEGDAQGGESRAEVLAGPVVFAENKPEWLRRNKWSIICLLIALCYCLFRRVLFVDTFGAIRVFMEGAQTYTVKIYALALALGMGMSLLDGRRGIPVFCQWDGHGPAREALKESARNAILMLGVLLTINKDLFGIYLQEGMPAMASAGFIRTVTMGYLYLWLGYTLARNISPGHEFLFVKIAWALLAVLFGAIVAYSLYLGFASRDIFDVAADVGGACVVIVISCLWARDRKKS